MEMKNNLEAADNKPFFNQEQIQILKDGCNMKGATDAEFALFGHICKRSGLDPFARQIYSIKRGNQRTIQTGIDGFRLIAERSGNYAGSSKITYFNSEGLPFKEDSGRPPSKAEITIQKIVGGHVCNFTAEARWSEYNPGNNHIWKKMPATMLGKCAESLALRKAFPADLSGLYTKEEMAQAGGDDGEHPRIANTIKAIQEIKNKPKPFNNDNYILSVKRFCHMMSDRGVPNPVHIILGYFKLNIADEASNRDTLLTLNDEFKIKIKDWVDEQTKA
jgi:phage recombination protein Bet